MNRLFYTIHSCLSIKHLLIFLFVTVTTSYGQDILSDVDFEKAKTLYEEGDFKGALEYYNLEEDYTAEQYIFFSKCFDQLRDFKNEATILSLGLEKDNENVQLYGRRAGFYERMRSYDWALRDFSKAIKFAKDDSTKNYYLADRAWTKFLMNDLDGAIEDCNTVLSNDSLHLDSYNVLGVVYDELGNIEMAKKMLLKCYSYDSTNTNLVSNIGFFYQNIGDFEGSLFYFDKAIELSENNAVAYNNRGYSKLKLGDLEGALEDVELSMEMFENNSYSHRNRALIYIEMGKTKKACKDIEYAIGLGFTRTYGDELEKLQAKYCK